MTSLILPISIAAIFHLLQHVLQFVIYSKTSFQEAICLVLAFYTKLLKSKTSVTHIRPQPAKVVLIKEADNEYPDQKVFRSVWSGPSFTEPLNSVEYIEIYVKLWNGQIDKSDHWVHMSYGTFLAADFYPINWDNKAWANSGDPDQAPQNGQCVLWSDSEDV